MNKFGLGLLTIGGSVFLLVLASFALTGCVGGEADVKPLFVPEFTEGMEKLPGVWVLRDDNTPSYTVAGDYEQAVCQTGTLHNWIVLVDPPTKDDQVFLEGKDPAQFFFRDQLEKADTPVYWVKKLASSYKEAGVTGEISIQDDHNWFLDGEQSLFLMDTTLRIKDNHPGRIYLTDDEVPVEWIRDGGWSHFFRREDVVLLNPECLPELVPPGKM